MKPTPQSYQGVLIGAADASERHLTVSNQHTVLQSALTQGIAFPHQCRAGGCGSCKCWLIKGRVKELTDKSFLLSAEEIAQNVILACQSIPQSDVTLRVNLASATPATQSFATTIVGMEKLTDDILHLQLHSDQPLHYLAGQYAELTLPHSAKQGDGITRPYSFASPATDQGTGRLNFFIRHVAGGVFGDWLFQVARVGEPIMLRAPFGEFYRREGNAPMLCIAGGSGLAPILAILADLRQQGKTHLAITLMFGARTQQDLYAQTQIKSLQQHWQAHFNYVPVLSHEPASSSWAGRRGFLHEHIKVLLGNTATPPTAYVCGPPPMIDASVAVLHAAEVSDIYTDRF